MVGIANILMSGLNELLEYLSAHVLTCLCLPFLSPAG